MTQITRHFIPRAKESFPTPEEVSRLMAEDADFFNREGGQPIKMTLTYDKIFKSWVMSTEAE